MEIECKFEIPPERLEAVEEAMRAQPVRRTRLQARYFDSADGVLAAHGVVLRLRKEGRTWVQTAKAADAGPLQRQEHNVELGTARGAALLPLITRHHGTPVGERLAGLLHGGSTPLVETFATDIWRLSRLQRRGDTVVELALDLGRVFAPVPGGGMAQAARVCELEIELVSGAVPELIAIAQLWARQHRLWLSQLSKAERGRRLLQGQPVAVAARAAPPHFGGAAAGPLTGLAWQRAVAAACLAQILPNASEIAAGSDDAEQIHQLRVGLRRLRTALRELGALADGFDPTWPAPVVEVFRVLGAQRDRSQLLQNLLPRLLAVGAPPFTLPADDTTAQSVGDAVRATEFQSTLLGLVGLASPQPDDGVAHANVAEERTRGAGPAAARRHLRQRLDALHARVVRDGRRFTMLDPDQQHQLRKRLKRLRYLAEFVAPVFGPQRASRYLERLAPAQDALGSYCDDLLALQHLRAATASDPRVWFAVGWLTAQRADAAQRCHKALRPLAAAPRFWRRNG